MKVGDHGYHRDFPDRRGVIVWVGAQTAKLKYFKPVASAIDDTITISKGFIVIDVSFEEKAK